MARIPENRNEIDDSDLEVNERLLPPNQDGLRADAIQKLPNQPTDKNNWKTCLKKSSLALVIVSLTTYTFFMGILIGNHWKNRVIDVVCLERISRPSPLLPSVQPSWTELAFNGSLLKESVYRQSAGPEVDAAWKALGIDYRPIVVSNQSGKDLGLDKHVRVNYKYGGGFPANIEGLHHLHCLNLLRQALYFNVDHYRSQGVGAWKNEEWLVQKHITHCLDIIRQQLMCTVDMGVMGQVWVNGADADDIRPFVDFNTVHMCRAFDAVRGWAEEHQVEVDVPADFLQPPDDDVRIYPGIP